MITSWTGIISILNIWALFIVICAWGAANLDIDFKQTYFISATAYINEYISRQDTHYKSGETINFYVDNSELDYTTYENQINLENLNNMIKTCENCS
jgi:hypothetical protein